MNANASNDRTVASGNNSRAEGSLSRAGDAPSTFTIAANGTTVTIAGDVTAFFVNGDMARIKPSTPVIQDVVSRTITSVPAFAAGNTTFSISSAIDTTTTGGSIVDAARGAAAHAEGDTSVATGLSSHAEGKNGTASGPQCHVEGVGCTASGNPGAHAEGRENIASGDNGAHAEGYNGIASGESSHSEGFGGVASEEASHARNYNARAQAFAASASGWGAVTGQTGQGHAAEEVRGGGEAFGGFAHGGIQSGAVTYHVEVGASTTGVLADALGTAAWTGENDFNYTFWIELTYASKVSPAVAGQSAKLKVDAHQTGGAFVVDGQTTSEGTDPGSIGASVVASASGATMVLTVTNALASVIRVVATLRWNALSTT
jgi:hypothetical protein